MTPRDRSLLTRVIREILREERRDVMVHGDVDERPDYELWAPEPDEPRVAPDEALGRYIWPAERMYTAYHRVPEDDTRLEADFLDALKLHYDQNDHDELRKLWPKLVEFDRQGLYPDLLDSPPGRAYRLLSVDRFRAAEVLGVSRQELVADPGVAHRAPSPPVYGPRSFISSWSMDPKELVNSSWGEFLKISSKDITVLLVADTSAGNFLMNPEGFGAGWRLGNRYNHETEVIAGGQVPLVSAAWIWFGETAGRQRRGASSSNKPHARVLDKLLAAVEETGRMLGDDRP